MRRGLISWSREEVPAAVLETRVSSLQEAMRNAELGAVLVYTSFARPSAVAWLTHFVPYWNEALLLVFPTGAPVLLAAFSRRVHDWIREVSHLGEVRSAPDLGRAAVAFLKERTPGRMIGVVELGALPWSVAEPMIRNGWGENLVDASDLFAAIRQPADEIEIKLARRAWNIAARAFEAIPPRARHATEVLAAVESSARLDGAEEVLPRLACDLGGDSTLRRLEGDAHLGDRYTLELSLAYKAVWVRVTRSRCSSGELPKSWQDAAKWWANSIERWDETRVMSGPGDAGAAPPGRLCSWVLETCIGSQPLSLVAGSECIARRALPAGTLLSVSLQLDLEDGPWLCADPVVLGGGGRPAQPLA